MKILTPKPPVSLFESARVTAGIDWTDLYTVPFYLTEDVTVAALGQYRLASAIASSWSVTNKDTVAADLSVRVLSSKMTRYTTTLVSGSGDGSDRLEFKGVGDAEDNLGAAIDDVRVEDTGGTNYILNGSFEDVAGLIKRPYGYVGVGAIPNWTDYNPTTRLDIHQDTRNGILPINGFGWLDTRGTYDPTHPLNGNIHVYQDVGGLSAGQSYTLSFGFGDDGDRGNGVSIYWGGELVDIGGITALPSVISKTLLTEVSVPANSTVQLLLGKNILVTNDIVQVKASEQAALDINMSYVLSTREPYPTV